MYVRKVKKDIKKFIRKIINFPGALIPGTSGRLQLMRSGEKTWTLRGRASKGETSLVECFLGQRLFSQTLIQKDGYAKYFRFRFEENLLFDIIDQTSLVIKTERRTYTVKISIALRKAMKKKGNVHTESYATQLEQGYILGSSGKLMLPMNNDKNWVERTLDHYTNANKIFQELFGYSLFIAGGSLLGWAREKDILSFDHDFDVAYVSKTSSPSALREEFRTIIITLLQKGHTISLKKLNQTGLRRHCFWWKLDDSVSLDVFPGAFVDGKYCRPTFVETSLAYADLFPLKEEMLRGYKVLVPNDYERKLAAVYGPSWRIPDPFWAKTRSEFILRYLESIRMNREDLELVAKNSSAEADFIRNYLRDNNF